MRSIKRLSLSSLVFATTCFLMTQAWGASLSFMPSTTTVEISQTFGVEIWIDGLENTDLGAFDFNVLYYPTILAFDSYTLSTGLGDVVDALDISLGDDGAGSINLAEVSLLSALSFQENSLLLATLTFTGISAGYSSLTFDGVVLGDAVGDSITCEYYDGNGNVNVNNPATAPVPEPSTILLLGSGLIGLAGYGRRQKKS